MQPDTQQNPKPERTKRQRIADALIGRPIRILGALLLSVVFWAILIGSDPTLPMEKTFTNASVTVTGLEALRNSGLTILDEGQIRNLTVKMRVEVQQSNYEKATAERFSPRLDLSTITQTGTNRIYFTAGSEAYGTVLSFEPEYIEVEIDEYAPPTRKPVVVEDVGEYKEPLWHSTATVEPSYVLVSGPKSLVDQVVRARVQLPLGALSSERSKDSISALITLQDADGNTISSPSLIVTSDSVTIDSVRISVNVYPIKEISISAASAVTGTPAHGYTLGEVRISPDTILIAADQETLDSIDMLHVTTPVDISGKTVVELASSTIRGLSGFAYSSATEVVIEADIEQATHAHTYIGLPITVMGRDSSLSATLDYDMMSIILRGDYSDVESLPYSSIFLYVDATGLGEGVHSVEVLCSVDGVAIYDFEPEMATVTLTLTR